MTDEFLSLDLRARLNWRNAQRDEFAKLQTFGGHSGAHRTFVSHAGIDIYPAGVRILQTNAVPATGWIVLDHLQILRPSNFHQLRDTIAYDWRSRLGITVKEHSDFLAILTTLATTVLVSAVVTEYVQSGSTRRADVRLSD